MKLIRPKSIGNNRRNQVNIQKSLLSDCYKVLKNCKIKKHGFSGRSSNTGHVTVRHKGGGVKRLYRPINEINKKSISVVVGINYDPNRSAFVQTSFCFKNKSFFNAISSNFIYVGQQIITSTDNIQLIKGNRTKIDLLPNGTLINSISCNQSNILKYVKSAGTCAQIIQTDKKKGFVKIRLPSNKVIEIQNNSFVTIGRVSNLQHRFLKLGKAGRNRLKSIRPTVRGIAMNPVDHPHGGRSNGGMPSVSPWGLPTKSKFRLRKKKKFIK